MKLFPALALILKFAAISQVLAAPHEKIESFPDSVSDFLGGVGNVNSARYQEFIDSQGSLLKLGQAIRNLQITCPGVTESIGQSSVPFLIQERLREIQKLLIQKRKALLPAKIEKFFDESVSSTWDQKEWKNSGEWSSYLASLPSEKQNQILEILYLESLTRFLNPELWSSEAQKKINFELRASKNQRPVKDIFLEMKSRIHWGLEDKYRPPFGHAMKSCGMACSSHVASLYGREMDCWKIDHTKNLVSQLDQIENKNEPYDLVDLIRKQASK